MPSFPSTASLWSCLTRKGDTDAILIHLALANLLVLLSPGIPHTMAAFVFRKPLSGLGCKFVYYIQRVARGTTLCSTCVLSTYQAFTLTPRRAEGVMIRGGAPRVTGPSCCTCWMLSLLKNIFVPVTVTGPQDTGNDTDNQGKWFCSSSPSAATVLLRSVSDAVSYPHGLVQWLHGASPAETPPEGAVYSHPTGHHRCPPGDQSRPHRPDAGGHPCQLLHTEFNFQFLHHCSSGVFVVGAGHSYSGFVSPLLAPSS
ncbi:hypothetical protein FD755_023413 [Muntiacus reevesi]|uniref:Vomeronasal type-1 receptor n=1 Tax=Muntiacus reevesi TaxID=9886 RepID=A0A5N3VZQ7_MUNRE|nr:hypothetical protein FD755_023413 [Muntiacus reevesi]